MIGLYATTNSFTSLINYLLCLAKLELGHNNWHRAWSDQQFFDPVTRLIKKSKPDVS